MTLLVVAKNLVSVSSITAIATAAKIKSLKISTLSDIDKVGSELPIMAVVDMMAGDEVVGIIKKLRDMYGAEFEILAFYPHVREDLKSLALQSGASDVIPNSKIDQVLSNCLASDETSPLNQED